jgi:enamine deaminase RidA (YjgF/YER057c/UK114 family)
VPTTTRILQSPAALEIYMMALPSPSASVEAQAKEAYGAVRDRLRDGKARIFEERVFASEAALKTIRPLRKEILGDLDDGVPPVELVAPASAAGAVAGVHVHAVRCDAKPLPVRHHDVPRGRILRGKDLTWITILGLSAPDGGKASDQARLNFEAAAAILREARTDLRSVARTWLWLGDIIAWYADFNSVRNTFFHEQGLLNCHPGKTHLPASTGIGLKPAGAALCGLDLIAVVGAEGVTEYLQAAGKQQSAYQYGSAFSRAATTTMPGGRTVFVSGTASIDAAGKTTYVGDSAGQIRSTVENVRAVLADGKCADSEVVHALAYCKTPEVEKVWRKMAADVPWPCITVLGDVCRDDLLFEIEATGCPGARGA